MVAYQTIMAAGCDGSRLISSLLRHNNKQFQVFLTPKTFCWTSEGIEEPKLSKFFNVIDILTGLF